MSRSKRQKSTYSNKSTQRSVQICPRCTRNLTSGRKSSSGVLNYYKNLCKSSKCKIHRSFTPNITRVSKHLIKDRIASTKKSETKTINRIKIPESKLTVEEFEDEVSNTYDIEPELFEKIEATIEDLNTSMTAYFEDSIGYRVLKEIISRTIIWPLKKPDIFKGLRTAPKGVLLFGPPGTGKTFLGKYIAYEAKSTFFNISASTLVSKWMGDSEKLVRIAFLVARARQPSVIFIDEIDSILSRTTSEDNGSARRMKNEFLVCMDNNNSAPEDRIMVIGSTSRPQELDETARQRFFKRLYIPLPDETDRREILLKLLEQECHSLENSDISEIVQKTGGYSITDIKNLCQEAAMGPIKALAGNAFTHLEFNKIRPISMADFLCALQLIKPTVSSEQVQNCEEWDTMYGYGGDESTIQRKLSASKKNVMAAMHFSTIPT